MGLALVRGLELVGGRTLRRSRGSGHIHEQRLTVVRRQERRLRISHDRLPRVVVRNNRDLGWAALLGLWRRLDRQERRPHLQHIALAADVRIGLEGGEERVRS